MRIVHGPVVYELDEAWWEEAGVGDYRPQTTSYAHIASVENDRAVVLISVADVEPLQRRLSNGVFNDSLDSGTARDRVIRLLRGFRAGDRVPPIELDRLEQPADYSYRLYHGAHRFYCSLVFGFTHVPAIVYEPSEWKRSR